MFSNTSTCSKRSVSVINGVHLIIAFGVHTYVITILNPCECLRSSWRVDQVKSKKLIHPPISNIYKAACKDWIFAKWLGGNEWRCPSRLSAWASHLWYIHLWCHFFYLRGDYSIFNYTDNNTIEIAYMDLNGLNDQLMKCTDKPSCGSNRTTCILMHRNSQR